MKRLVVSEGTGALQVEESVTTQVEEPVVETTLREKVHAYFALTKPRIIELLLITTVPSMIVAARGMPPWDLILFTLIGGALAAGGANAINCYIDRDIDQVMHRTKKRPLPAHKIEPLPRSRVRKRPRNHRLRSVVGNRQSGVGPACDRRPSLLRVRLHARLEAIHSAEHRDRRSRRSRTGSRRVGRGHRKRRGASSGVCSGSSFTGPRRTSGPSR